MAFERTPWFIGLDGVEHSAEVARMLAWGATNGSTGIIKPTDLQVRAQSVPGPSVRIMPGGFAAESTYPGASQQSYIERAPTATDLEVPATGSSGGATRYVVGAVLDPSAGPGGGSTPAIPNEGTYAEPRLVSSLNQPYPLVPLAKIVQPANTSAITNAMITDLREVANPRTLDVWRPRALLSSEDEALGVSGEDGEWFPNIGGEQLVDIPEWATRAQIEAHWLQVRVGYGEHAYGQMWVEYGPYKRPSTRERTTQRYQWDTVGTRATTYRENWIVADDVYIPKAYRGTTQAFIMKARRDGSTPVAAVKLDGVSGVSLKVRFLEVADPSSS